MMPAIALYALLALLVLPSLSASWRCARLVIVGWLCRAGPALNVSNLVYACHQLVSLLYVLLCPSSFSILSLTSMVFLTCREAKAAELQSLSGEDSSMQQQRLQLSAEAQLLEAEGALLQQVIVCVMCCMLCSHQNPNI